LVIKVKSKSKTNKNVKNRKTKKVNKTKKPIKIIQRGGNTKRFLWYHNDKIAYFFVYDDSNTSNSFKIYNISDVDVEHLHQKQTGLPT
jgi:hypothetical protein